MAETITDPDGMVLSFGWDALAQGGQGEIGDLCEGTEDRLDGYSVQKLWSNKASACVTSSPASTGGGCPSGWHDDYGYCAPDNLPNFGCSGAGTPFGALALLGLLAVHLRRGRRA